MNYDTCHLALQYEEPRDVVRRFKAHGIKISKLHLSSALKVRSTPEVRHALAAFADDVYLHQVLARAADGSITRYKDLPLALAAAAPAINHQLSTINHPEWRIHFHVPVHSPKTALFDNTADHITDLLEILKYEPTLCPHLEIETYTWEVLPPEMKNENVVTQLTREYDWCLKHLIHHGLANPPK